MVRRIRKRVSYPCAYSIWSWPVSAAEAHALPQPHDGGGKQRKQPERKPVVIPDDPPPLEPADPVFDLNPNGGQVAILGTVLAGQVAPFGRLVGYPHPRNALRGQVARFDCGGIALFPRALVVEPFIGGRPWKIGRAHV